MRKLVWYWHRMRAMGLSEIFFRCIFFVRKSRWRKQKQWQAPTPKLNNNDTWSPGCQFSEVGEEKALVLSEAYRYLSHQFKLLNVNFNGDEIDWHMDPETGVRSAMKFGMDIDYRDRNVAGNVKNIWEINRHQHLTLLAVAYALTREEHYAQEVERQLESWLDANPFLIGVNWSSSLEVGMRLISWVWIERLLRQSDSHDKLFGNEGILWPSIYWHQWFIYRHRSYGSSSNNHLVGEVVGLFIAAVTWPYFDESRHWELVARDQLEKEVLRQTFPSGLNRELAFRYHLFSTELFLLAALEGSRRRTPFSSKYTECVKRMIEVIPLLVDCGGNHPTFGDEDGGRAIHMRPLVSSRMESLYWLGALLTGARVPLLKGDHSLLSATYGLPKEIPYDCKWFEIPKHSLALEDAGLYVMVQNRGTQKEIFSLVDAGPVGFLNIAAHGHADALAFTLSVGGTPVIVDVGTFSYFPEQQDERNYFRGTRAHNTITVDKADQSVSGGPFLWIRKANAHVLNWRSEKEVVELFARQDGYTRFARTVVHGRKISLNEDKLSIVDEIQGSGKHNLEWRLHFHPDRQVTLEEKVCRVVCADCYLEIELDADLDWKILYGQKEGGWYSPGFNLKVPTSTLVGSVRTELPRTLKNVIKINFVS